MQLNLDSKLGDLQFSGSSVKEQSTPLSWKFLVLSPDNTRTGLLSMTMRSKTQMEEKHCLLWSHQNNPTSAAKKAAFTFMCSKVQCKLRSMQDS